MHNLEQLDKETERLFQLLKVIQANKNKADTVWEKFCKDMDKNKPTKGKYFEKHPKNISNSSSEILSPRPRTDFAVNRSPIKAKSSNAIKFAEPIDDLSDGGEVELDDGRVPSVEVVTIREEYPLQKPMLSNERIVKLYDRNARGRDVKVSGKTPMTVVTKRKSSKELKNATLKSKEDDLSKEILDKKIHGIMEKCLHCMEDVRMQLDIGITPPDGLEDLERRKKRSSEFASRFSRNYLYQLNRHISDIKKIFKSSSAKSNPQNVHTVKQKLTWSYQTILQGLQAYLTHLPISTTVSVPDKIKELLKEVATLCDIQRSCVNVDMNSNVKNNEIVDIFEVRSRCLIEKIDEYYASASIVSLPLSQSKFSLLESSKARKNNNIKSRYSMYNGIPVRKDVYWKRAVAALAKKKYNVQSKYKTAYFKHRPPVEKQTVQKPTIKARPIEKKSSTIIQEKPTIDDDNIKTMMEIEQEKNQNCEVREIFLSLPQVEDDGKSDGALIPLVERLVERLKLEKTEMTREQARCLLREAADSNAVGELASRLSVEKESEKHPSPSRRGVGDEELVGKLLEVIRNHQVLVRNGKENEEVKDTADKDPKCRKERKQTITISGAKNAQLICIRDDSSIVEVLDEANDSESQQHHTLPKEGNKSTHSDLQFKTYNKTDEDRSDCNCRHYSHDNEATQKESEEVKRSPSNGNVSIVSGSDRASKIKISRLPKVQLQPLKMLPKKFALNILEYKINYLKARKGDHMYQKSKVKQPWILMGEISDKILEELLAAIGSEIEVNHVIERIYASEFV